tara:strand:+ start:95 stop:1618 length:1524 start_codon:yes stop_codon:yes gene_type:complete
MNLLSVFDSNVRKYADKDFIRYNGVGITYSEAQHKTYQVTTFLNEQGIQKGDTVAVFTYNCPSFIYFLFGAWRVGATVVPVNHKLKAKQLDYILTDSKAKFLLFDAALAPVVNEISSEVLFYTTEGEVENYANFDAAISGLDVSMGLTPLDSDLAEILYTSGTTGNPKGCMHTHNSVCMAALAAVTGTNIQRNERTLIAMPIWHSSPLNNWFGGTVFMGGTVILLREYHPLHFMQAIQDEKTTLYFGAPISYSMPIRMLPHFDSFDLSSMRACLYGGGPISIELSKTLMAKYNSTEFYQVFGMTETGPSGMILYPEEHQTKAGSIGKCGLPAVDIRVVDEDGWDVSEDQIGEIWMKAPSVMKGYLNNPEATKEVFTEEGWYKTGDMARIDEDGFLFVADRKKDMIITGGENVYSKQVEDALAQHEHIVEVAVIGTPHPEWGETVTAVIVSSEDQTLCEEEIKTFLANELPDYCIPRIFHFTDVLPRNPSGKVQKFILRKQLEILEID